MNYSDIFGMYNIVTLIILFGIVHIYIKSAKNRKEEIF